MVQRFWNQCSTSMGRTLFQATPDRYYVPQCIRSYSSFSELEWKMFSFSFSRCLFSLMEKFGTPKRSWTWSELTPDLTGRYSLMHTQCNNGLRSWRSNMFSTCSFPGASPLALGREPVLHWSQEWPKKAVASPSLSQVMSDYNSKYDEAFSCGLTLLLKYK